MKRIFLANVWLFVISSMLIMVACRSGEHPRKDNPGMQQEEMPKPGSSADIDSLKRIQQTKRDSLLRHKP